jgi:selenocysteine lyase/cysteine desulfurase
MPEIALDAMRRFELEARANVHEGVHRIGRAATASYEESRRLVARFLRRLFYR